MFCDKIKVTEQTNRRRGRRLKQTVTERNRGMNVNDHLKRICELEKPFSANIYDGGGPADFVIEPGTCPVMISAPHAVNHFRCGQEKKADMYTGGLARYLHEVTGCHVICSCRQALRDPNYDPPGANPYQDAVMAHLEKHRIFALVDLHGLARWREYAMEIGTAPVQPGGQGGAEDPSLHGHGYIADAITAIFGERFSRCAAQQEICKNRHFNAGSQNTVTKYISEHSDTACVQLEINRNYRDPDRPEALRELTEGLIELVRFLEEADRRNRAENGPGKAGD